MMDVPETSTLRGTCPAWPWSTPIHHHKAKVVHIILAVLALASVSPFVVPHLLSPRLTSMHARWLASSPRLTGTRVYILQAAGNTTAAFGTFRQMQRQLGASNVFMLVDDTHLQLEGCVRAAQRARQPGDSNVICINHNESLIVNRTGFGINHQEGSKQLLVYRYLAKSPFRFLWTIEADIRCNGNWHACLQRTDALPDDFVCRLPSKNAWNSTDWWWNSFAGDLAGLPLKERWGCWMQIRRFSRRALDLLEAQVGRSSGFMEVYYSTLYMSKGFSVGAVDEEDVGLFSFDARGVLAGYPTFQDDKLYHPIKVASLGGT